MDTLSLHTATSNQQVDDILIGTIRILETLFPHRIRAYYLHGSFADDTCIETSDIDLFLVSRGTFTIDEQEKIQYILQSISLCSPLFVEGITVDESILLQKGHFRIKSASRLLWGDDIRADIPEQTLDQYLHMYAHFPFIYLSQMLRGSDTLSLPLAYPQASDEFYGYAQHILPPGNESRHNIKKLVTEVCWIATVLIAWNAGKTVSGKHASMQMYKEYIHDEWTLFVEEMYEKGNQQWRYLVPHAQEERQRLRELCAQTLAFEQYYVTHYKGYLLELAQKDDESKSVAARQLAKIQ